MQKTQNSQSQVYSIHEIANRLRICEATAKAFCNKTYAFPVKKLGSKIRVLATGFDSWLDSDEVFLVAEAAELLNLNLRSMYNYCNQNPDFRIIRVESNIRIPTKAFLEWINSPG